MIEEKIVIGENTKYPLKGLLTLPAGATNPVPAVVFVHGSGASNMDEKVGKLTPFKDLAHGWQSMESHLCAMTSGPSPMALNC